MEQNTMAQKEATIKELAIRVEQLAKTMRANLNEQFGLPEMQRDDKDVPTPSRPVLDEIIETLTECLRVQGSNLQYLQDEVFPKIS